MAFILNDEARINNYIPNEFNDATAKNFQSISNIFGVVLRKEADESRRPPLPHAHSQVL